MDFFENKTEAERAVLVSVDTGEFDVESSLAELTELAKTAGAEVICEMTQKREAPEPGTYLGRGKLEELSDFCENEKPDLVIIDGELSPAQQKNIETITDVRVIDRTTLILDIFAQRALSGEGKLQVELAQLKYALPRLGGKGASMSRLGGGIGTRGPGETKLETDRRHIRRRISALTEDLKALDERRTRYRERRKKDGVSTVALVGYTNAGKSTLMNTLTDAGVLAENKLFATLDPTARALTLPDGNTVLLIDTVGFIRNLPHHLIKAFKSTLDEATYSDILLIVIDSSDPEFIARTGVTTQLLEELGAVGKKTIYAFNKCDVCADRDALIHMKTLAAESGTEVVFLSAKTGAGCDTLVEKIERMAQADKHRITVHIPPEDGAVTGIIYKEGDDVEMDYREDGIRCTCIADDKLYAKLKKYIIEEN